MPDPEEVRAALARLAAGDGPLLGGPAATFAGPPGVPTPETDRSAEPTPPTPEDLSPDAAAAVVDVAAGTTDDLEAAAAFADAGGVGLLARAVEAAEETGDVEVARRGQRALAAFRWVRRAARASGEEPARPDHLGEHDGTRDAEKSDDDAPTTSAPVTEPL